MDFTFDETQRDLQTLARAILEKVTPARVGEIESADGVDHDVWKEFAASDLLGLALPAEAGGSGHGIMEVAVLLEEVGRRTAPIPLLSTVVLGAMPVAAFGSAAQRAELLPGVCDGSSFLTAALQEGARHDPLQPSTTATRDGSAWRLDGVKVGVPHATFADAVTVSAATEDGPRLFLVDPRSSGVTIEPARATNREPQGNVVLAGATGDAIDDPAAMTYLHRHALAGMCATAVGVLDEAVRITASYITQRQQFGKPIATFQGATLKAADAYIDTEAVRATTWSAIWRLAEGLPCDEELAIAKYWVAEGGQNAVHACQHLHGGMGVDTDYPIHRYFLWSKELEITLGGATPQLLKIGAHIAGDV